MKIEKIELTITEPILLNYIKSKASQQGFSHSLSFWLKMYLVRRFRLNEREFFREYQICRRIKGGKFRTNNLEKYNFMREQNMKESKNMDNKKPIWKKKSNTLSKK